VVKSRVSVALTDSTQITIPFWQVFEHMPPGIMGKGQRIAPRGRATSRNRYYLHFWNLTAPIFYQKYTPIHLIRQNTHYPTIHGFLGAMENRLFTGFVLPTKTIHKKDFFSTSF
jgi:hypothetical protein